MWKEFLETFERTEALTGWSLDNNGRCCIGLRISTNPLINFRSTARLSVDRPPVFGAMRHNRGRIMVTDGRTPEIVQDQIRDGHLIQEVVGVFGIRLQRGQHRLVTGSQIS